jgi:hypothetical protein
MGVIYKLKPEIKDFILEQKRKNVILSCRGLTNLVQDKFKIKLSKSSINSLIKQAGLSMPVGRRLKKRRRKTPLKLIEFKPQVQVKLQERVEGQKPIEIKTEELIEPMVSEPIVSSEKTIEEPVVTSAEDRLDIKLEVPSESECSGAILLKAADCLLGGSQYITAAVKNRLNKQEGDLLAKTESLIYLPLLGLDEEALNKDLTGLWAIIDKKIPLEDILLYRNELQSVKTINSDIFRVISNTLQQIRCIKVNLVDGNTFYLDGQAHTIWSTPHIPHDFSSTLYNIKGYINKYLYEDIPFTLFMAPGYDTPTKEFFYFLLSLDTKEKKISKLILYGNKFEELETITIEKAKRRFFVFGVWAWQFVEHRKVNKIGEFKPFHFEPLNQDFFAAEIEIELTQPDVKQSVTLRGCALKMSLSEKTRLLILTNLPPDLALPDQLAHIYLNRWPNLEEKFKDYSGKVELFTYTGSSQRFLSPETLNLQEKTEDLSVLFEYYLKALDLYVKWHFLPLGHEEEAFSSVNEHFYSLKAILKMQKDYYYVELKPPPNYPFLKELEYACRRVNEKLIIISETRRLWLRL